ncbi:alpha/beta fold hydrolase [Atopobiaceae bacterium 24-176]
MQLRTFTIASPFDGLELSCAEAVPDNGVTTVGLVQFSHGMEEHKERYYPFMEWLAHHGFASVIHDHRGHGASVKDPSDLGFFYDHSGRAIVGDVLCVQERFKGMHPGLPLVLFGHSMGSLVVRSLIKDADDAIDGLVVCGAPGNNPGKDAAMVLVNALSMVKGPRAKSALVNSLVFGGYGKGLPGDHPLRWLSANEENVRRYDEDALCGFVFTLNGYQNLLSLVRDVYDVRGWAVKRPDLPILFIAGADDPVTLGEKAWKDAQGFLRDRGYDNVSGKLYPGMRHEILNEDGAQEVFDDVLAFIQGVCGL